MRQNCKDVFEEYNLPLETYFFDCEHKEIATHNNLEIIWVLKGEATLTVDDVVHHMHKESVFLVHHNQRHIVEAKKGTIIIAYRLKQEYLHRRGLFFEKFPYKGNVLSFEYLAEKYKEVPLLLVQFMKLLLSKENPEMIYYKIIAYYNFYISEIYKMFLKERYLDMKSHNYETFLERSEFIVDYVYKHYHETIKLTDLQEHINLSQSRLSHFIKETLGVSFQEFVQNIRFERALTLLRTTKFSIQEVSTLSGFSDQKYLNKMMKKELHMTALSYRKQYKERLYLYNNLKREYQPFLDQIRDCLIKLEENKNFKKLFEIEPIYQCIY